MNGIDNNILESNGSKNWFRRIMAYLMILLSLLFLSGLLASCVSSKKYNEALDEVAKLKVQSQMDGYERVDTLYEGSDDIYQLRQSLLAREQQLDSVMRVLDRRQEQPTLATKILEELNDGDWKVEKKKGRLSVDVENDILFNTGESTLSTRGLKKIEKLAASINNREEEVHVWVVGHTDGKPYSSATMDNWDLSAQRALSVTRALIDAGLKSTDIVAAARGSFDPEGSNKQQVGRILNRRTEILIVPKSEWSEVVAQFVTSL